MQDIKRKAEAVTQDFIENLTEIAKIEEDKRRELDNKINACEKQQTELREQKTQNNKTLKLHTDKINNEIEEHKKLNDQLRDENFKHNEQNKQLNVLIQEADALKKEAKTCRDLASEELIKQQDKTKRYQQKLDALKIDDDKLDNKRKQIVQEERLLDIKKGIALTESNKNSAESKRLSELSLDLQIKKKNIEIQEKRIKAR